MKKQNKIKVVVCADPERRRKALARLAVEARLAMVPSDAAKLIRNEIDVSELHLQYYVLADGYSFRGGHYTTQRLFELAACGLFVAVGVKALPREYEFLCEVFIPEDLA